MRWLQTEYLLKGVYFGLVLYAALQVAALPVLALAAGLVAAGLSWLGLADFGSFAGVGRTYDLKNKTLFAVQLLLGIPFFYLLTFAGQEEESEVEIGATCAALSLGLSILT